MLFLALALLALGCTPKDDTASADYERDIDGMDCEPGPAWDHRELTWRAGDSFIDALGADGVYAIEEALQMWSGNAAGLSFTESSIADLVFHVYSGEHGDGHDFDGPGGVAAHAFDPGHSTHAGEIHLDGDEQWSEGPSYDDDILDTQTILAHELGHALGVCHADDPDALMNAHFHGRVEALTAPDLELLIDLYPSDPEDTGDSAPPDDTGDSTPPDDTGDTAPPDDTALELDCEDADGDGYGVGPDCLGADCDEADALVYNGPGETSMSDNKDNDCDGIIDEVDVPSPAR